MLASTGQIHVAPTALALTVPQEPRIPQITISSHLLSWGPRVFLVCLQRGAQAPQKSQPHLINEQAATRPHQLPAVAGSRPMVAVRGARRPLLALVLGGQGLPCELSWTSPQQPPTPHQQPLPPPV